jgi:hypothetical protein
MSPLHGACHCNATESFEDGSHRRDKCAADRSTLGSGRRRDTGGEREDAGLRASLYAAARCASVQAEAEAGEETEDSDDDSDEYCPSEKDEERNSNRAADARCATFSVRWLQLGRSIRRAARTAADGQ